jgi:large subunit ribosomal protein L35Ae
MDQASKVMNEEVLLRTTIPATFVSFRRSRHVVHERYALLKINNVTSASEAQKYIGNGVVAIKQNKAGEKHPEHGVITRIHGGRGIVRARFTRNLSPKAIGSYVFVKLYKVNKDEI